MSAFGTAAASRIIPDLKSSLAKSSKVIFGFKGGKEVSFSSSIMACNFAFCFSMIDNLEVSFLSIIFGNNTSGLPSKLPEFMNGCLMDSFKNNLKDSAGSAFKPNMAFIRFEVNGINGSAIMAKIADTCSPVNMISAIRGSVGFALYKDQGAFS